MSKSTKIVHIVVAILLIAIVFSVGMAIVDAINSRIQYDAVRKQDDLVIRVLLSEYTDPARFILDCDQQTVYWTLERCSDFARGITGNSP